MTPKKKGRVALERALSKLGLCSRAEASQKIRDGQVKVHGVVEANPLRLVNPDSAHIEIEGKKVSHAETLLVLFHKPKGVVTTKRDPEGRKTIYDLLPAEYYHLHPVGRLDMNSTGLLLLTNNTKLSHFLTGAENRITRVYIVKVKGEVLLKTLTQFREGVVLDGESLRAEKVKALKTSGKESTLELTLIEGKNREIRRLALALGHEVMTLKRISYGPYQLGDLGVGGHQIIEGVEGY